MRADVGILSDERGNISFHLLSDNDVVIGIGNFVPDIEADIINTYRAQAEIHRLTGMDVFIIPENDNMKLSYVCSGCKNTVVVPNRLFNAEILESRINCDIDPVQMWNQILNNIVKCCDHPDYVIEEKEEKVEVKSVRIPVK